MPAYETETGKRFCELTNKTVTVEIAFIEADQSQNPIPISIEKCCEQNCRFVECAYNDTMPGSKKGDLFPIRL